MMTLDMPAGADKPDDTLTIDELAAASRVPSRASASRSMASSVASSARCSPRRAGGGAMTTTISPRGASPPA